MTSACTAPPSAPIRDRVPRVVWVLASAIFALGTGEFMIAGLLPELAADLRVSIPQAGGLIAAFAVGMIVGAPLMAVLTLRLPRRTTLIAALHVFVAGHVSGAVADGYALLLVSRVISAVATGAFWAVAAVVTVSAVPPWLRARALSVLLAGLTVATVVGVPLGTLIGQQFGWRSAFWAVGGLALLGLVGVLLSVAGGRPDAAAPRLADEVAAFRRGRLWLALATTAVYQGGVIAMFSYVTPLLTDVAGLDPSWVPAVLFAFGLIVLLGVVAFTVAAPLNARVFALAGTAPTLASASNTTEFTGSSPG